MFIPPVTYFTLMYVTGRYFGIKEYEYLKPTKGKREYVSLKKGYNDPLNLSKSIKKYKLGPGDLIIFSNRLLHESKQNSSKKITI